MRYVKGFQILPLQIYQLSKTSTLFLAHPALAARSLDSSSKTATSLKQRSKESSSTCCFQHVDGVDGPSRREGATTLIGETVTGALAAAAAAD